MNNDTNGHINIDGSYTCSIIHNTFVCYHNVCDNESDVKITIIITESDSGEKRKEEQKNE